MDADEKLRTAIMTALTARLPERLRVLARDYQQVEDAIMAELEAAGSYHDDGSFVVEGDEEGAE